MLVIWTYYTSTGAIESIATFITVSFGFTLLQKVWEINLVTFSHIADLIQLVIVLLLSCNLNYYMPINITRYWQSDIAEGLLSVWQLAFLVIICKVITHLEWNYTDIHFIAWGNSQSRSGKGNFTKIWKHKWNVTVLRTLTGSKCLLIDISLRGQNLRTFLPVII